MDNTLPISDNNNEVNFSTKYLAIKISNTNLTAKAVSLKLKTDANGLDVDGYLSLSLINDGGNMPGDGIYAVGEVIHYSAIHEKYQSLTSKFTSEVTFNTNTVYWLLITRSGSAEGNTIFFDCDSDAIGNYITSPAMPFTWSELQAEDIFYKLKR